MRRVCMSILSHQRGLRQLDPAANWTFDKNEHISVWKKNNSGGKNSAVFATYFLRRRLEVLEGC